MNLALDFIAHAVRPNLQIVLVRHESALGLVTRGLAAGAREVVASSNITSVVDAVRRLVTEPDAPRGPHGRVITVFAAKGGCGKTTLATNLAAVLHNGGTRRVCLVDLDLSFGDVASTLAMIPRRSLADANGRLDTERVANVVTPYLNGFDCLLAPAGPGEGDRVPPSRVGELLTALAGAYDYVVVDTPAQFSATVLAALDASHHQVLLTTPERPALKNLRLTLDMLDLLAYPRDARAIVVNRSDSAVGLTTGEVEQLVRNPIAGLLPSRRDVPASINRGVPLAITHPDHVVTTAIRRLVDEHLVVQPVVPAPAPDTAAEPKRDRFWGWW